MSRSKSTHAKVSNLPYACLAADPNETYPKKTVPKLVPPQHQVQT